MGRLNRQIEPWSGNEYEQITEYQYDDNDATHYSNEPSVIKKKLNRGSDQSKSSILLTYYTRTEENGIRRDVRERVSSLSYSSSGGRLGGLSDGYSRHFLQSKPQLHRYRDDAHADQ